MGPFNTVLNVAPVYTPDDKAFVSPNSDTHTHFFGRDDLENVKKIQGRLQGAGTVKLFA
jgi:hypothetical protein